MGNYRFKFSDMIPNAWFYKLKDMNRAMSHTNTSPTSKKRNPSHQNSTNHHPLKPHHHSQHHSSLPRKSYYFPRDLSPKLSAEPGQPDPPRRYSKQSRARAKRSPRPGTATAQAQSSSTSCSCRASLDSVWTRTESLAESPDSIFDSSPEFRLDRVLTPESFGTPCDCGAKPVSTDDIVIHVDENSFNRNQEKLRSFDTFPELELPPIVTKPKQSQPKYSENRDTQKSGPNKESRAPIKQKTGGGGKKFSVHSPGRRLRIRSPRIQAQLAARRVAGSETGGSKNTRSRRTLSESFAIVKSSFDPQKDFRESMLEMIVEHNIKASKDLEELLACYLSLNSDEYHELIIKVFKQIWFDLTDISFK